MLQKWLRLADCAAEEDGRSAACHRPSAACKALQQRQLSFLDEMLHPPAPPRSAIAEPRSEQMPPGDAAGLSCDAQDCSGAAFL